VKLVIGTKS